MKKVNHKPLFCVIIPVYNKEDYLQESIESVIGQTIGFKENIHIVLVNDGSTDNSPLLCQQFAAQFPDNITYLTQNNKGVSAARNVGLDHARGQYVSFFDADDIWDIDAFEKAALFFASHDDVAVLSARIRQFGDISAPHPLDYKYKRTFAADLNIYSDYIQPMIGNCFFSAAAIGGLKFDESLRYGEDTLFVNQILIDAPNLGILSDVNYYYRKERKARTASMRSSIERYRQNNSVYKLLYGLSKDKFGYVPSFIKQLTLYELCWQVFAQCEEQFTPGEVRGWHQDVNCLLVEITNEDIVKARWLTIVKRLGLLVLKNGRTFLQKISWDEVGRKAYNDGMRLLSLDSMPCIVVDRMRIEEGVLRISGITKVTFFDEGAQLLLQTKNGCVPIGLSPLPSYDVKMITGETIFKTYFFSCSISAKELIGTTISLLWRQSSSVTLALPLRFTLYGGLSSKKTYIMQEGIIVKKISTSVLKLMRARMRTFFASEYRMCREIIKAKDVDSELKAKLVFARLFAKLYRLIKRKPTWIFVDREYKAGDNAEALFRYSLKQPSTDDKNLFFLLRPTSIDYSRMKKSGKVLHPGSLKFYTYFLASDKLLSGHHDAAVTNPFGSAGKYVSDMFYFNFYNLSHGTLQGDLSSQLNKHILPVYRFFVSTRMEYDSLLLPEYGYTENEVKLTGMCRYDVYELNRAKKKILFMPTWRVAVSGRIIPGTREREFIPNFEDTDYCRKYNSLINNERLLEAMRQKGYTGEFFVHPNYEKQALCFHGNEVITVGRSSADYNQALSEGAIMVSDYSGVTFDFAYMRKPVIYYHFDNLFNGSHSYKNSYFNYVEQGFGPLCLSEDEVVDEIIKAMDNGGSLEQKYRSRIDGFFSFSDRNNCQRVFDVVNKD